MAMSLSQMPGDPFWKPRAGSCRVGWAGMIDKSLVKIQTIYIIYYTHMIMIMYMYIILK